MKKVYDYLLIGIFIMTALLAAVVGLRAYSEYMQEQAMEAEIEQQYLEEIMVRNTEANNRVLEMEAEISAMIEDVENLQAFIDETVAIANEVQNRKKMENQEESVPAWSDSVSDDTAVSGNESDSENVSVSGNETVSGNTVLPGGVTVSGNMAVPDGMTVLDSVVLPDGMTVSGNTLLVDGMPLSGNAVVIDGVTVSGREILSGSIPMPEGETVSGEGTKPEDEALSDSLAVSGNMIFQDGRMASGSMRLSNGATVSGNILLPDGADDFGRKIYSGGMTVSGNTIIMDEMTDSENNTLPDDIVIFGSTIVLGGMSVSGNMLVPDSMGDAWDTAGEDNHELADMTLEDRKALRTSFQETLEVNQADRDWIAGNEYDFSDMKIACLGDSLTAAANLEGEENYEQYTYPARLQQLLGAEEVYNLGIGGSSIGRYWADAFVERYTEIPADTDIIIVMGGTNDGFCVSDTEFGNLDERAYRTFCGDLNELMKGLRENYPDTVIFFATPLPNILQDYLMSEREYLLPQKDFVDVIKTLADEYDFEVVDLYNSNILDSHDANVIAEYMPDGVHGNPDGYQILAEHFASEIVKFYDEDEEREMSENGGADGDGADMAGAGDTDGDGADTAGAGDAGGDEADTTGAGDAGGDGSDTTGAGSAGGDGTDAAGAGDAGGDGADTAGAGDTGGDGVKTAGADSADGDGADTSSAHRANEDGYIATDRGSVNGNGNEENAAGSNKGRRRYEY